MEKLIHQSEIFKLGLGLDDRGIEYELIAFCDGLQIRVPSQGWDAICHRGSYGREDGLLEVAGDCVVNIDFDSVEGWLTADEVLKRVDKYFKRNG